MTARARAGEQTGSFLVEIAVAMVCTGLVTAGVLRLVVDGARTFRARHRSLEATARVDAAADALLAALESAGQGLEGGRTVSLDGARIDIVEVGASSVQVVMATGDAREAEPAPYGELRLADVTGLRVGDRVAGLGLVHPDTGEPPPALPVGRIAGLFPDGAGGPGGGVVTVDWSAPEAALLAEYGQPRALLPLTLRQLGVRMLADGLQLRRRDLDGPWQPVVDALDEVTTRTVAAGVVEVLVRASPPDAPRRTARRKVRLR